MKPGCGLRKSRGNQESPRGDGGANPSSLSKVMVDFQGLLGECFPKKKHLIPDLVDLSSDPSKLKEALSVPISTLPIGASRDDVALAASLFLARKVLPTPAGDPLPAYLLKMERYQTPNASFCEASKRHLDQLFPKGWDSRYIQYCSRALPSAGASFGTSRKDGGAREEIKSEMSRSEFVTACRTGLGITMSCRRRVSLVDDGGKTRIVTIADAKQMILGPLHHLLYDIISRRKFILKGEATANSFSEFERVRGEVFVSGDFEAATDNFNIHHSEFILEHIFKNCSSIPESIKRLALTSLSGTLETESGLSPQVAGQMMGNLLSFPLLCITNFLAFKYAIGNRIVPLRINGDDIVFRCTPKEADRWMTVVRDAGLVPSRGKTIVNEKYFSLNSTFFEAKFTRKPSHVPVIRAKCIYSPLPNGHATALAGRLRSAFAKALGYRKGIVRTHILRWHRKAVSAIGCSLNRGLGIRVYHPELVAAGLLEREVHYLQAPRGLDIPRVTKTVPFEEQNLENLPRVTEGWVNVPSGWMSKDLRSIYSEMWGEHCLKHAWDVGVVAGEIKMQPVKYGFATMGRLNNYVRLIHLSKRGLGRLLRCSWRRHTSVARWLYGTWRGRSKPDVIRVPLGEVAHLVPASLRRMFGVSSKPPCA